MGFQFGIRKTFPIPLDQAWEIMFSERGMKSWLGIPNGELELGKDYATSQGIQGKVRVFKPFSHIRFNWKKSEWDNMSTLQIRFIELGGKTTLSIHQEKLLDARQRAEMKEHWTGVMDQLSYFFLDALDH